MVVDMVGVMKMVVVVIACGGRGFGRVVVAANLVVVVQNLVLDRGEKIELLVDKTENLQFHADSFQRQGRQLRRKMWLQNFQIKLIVGGIILVLIIIIWLTACGGFKC
ncbi:hypothetical protein RJ639_031560 [Escallonia herrerae]|uniref:V-SNARE coiled-coil homology domain-containing protein n=1 Tax=Escallonia herrerae TaxID=1293975 RepID=A0AA89BHH1_9ASTE|nr:hypothetical protein RJ639_031560 [Escallonia herrerae]